MPTTTPPNQLNDEGTASMATAFMTSHHGLRRDIAQFRIALRKVAGGDHTRVTALGEEWQRYRNTLHGHHTVEDTAIFPGTKQQHPELAAVFSYVLNCDRVHYEVAPLANALPALRRTYSPW